MEAVGPRLPIERNWNIARVVVHVIRRVAARLNSQPVRRHGLMNLTKQLNVLRASALLCDIGFAASPESFQGAQIGCPADRRGFLARAAQDSGPV
jgi:hypothetical protein